MFLVSANFHQWYLRYVTCVETGSYQIVDLVQQFIHLLAVYQSYMTFAQKSPHLALQLHLVYIHHHHYRHQIIQHRRQQPILIMLQPLAFSLTQGVVPEEDIGQYGSISVHTFFSVRALTEKKNIVQQMCTNGTIKSLYIQGGTQNVISLIVHITHFYYYKNI